MNPVKAYPLNPYKIISHSVYKKLEITDKASMNKIDRSKSQNLILIVNKE